jgi:hypothetical protein
MLDTPSLPQYYRRVMSFAGWYAYLPRRYTKYARELYYLSMKPQDRAHCAGSLHEFSGRQGRALP